MSQARASRPEEMSRSYGFREVAAEDKQPLVDAVFHRVAGRYDLMNDAMSGGLHRLWKDAMVSRLNPPRRPGWRSLDVAGGTGDIAMRIVERSRRNAHVTVLDINGSMLQVGRERAERRGLSQHLDFVEANAEALPFADASFDAYTIALGIRNVPHIDRALSEAFRVLKHGGQFLCLEFSQVDLPFFERLYDQWSVQAIPRIGAVLAGDAEPYRYLVESIRKFPNQERFAGFIRDAGFAQVGYRNFTGGVTALHWGIRL
jgi:demethylmenaquinone methyltransferase/2-methoxy-6-polyprenyl-1,4-benzoquinol methylase